ncbi:MAG: AAA family ATPase [Actinobacteria bacterium]|nr:AAA family ATPase [Actinomycetota bacterium]
MFAVVLTGPPGSGKTTVLTALQNSLVDDGVRHAAIEVEALAWAHPPVDDETAFRHLAGLRQTYADAGYDVVLCGATVTSDAYLEGLLRALAAERTLVVRLEAEPATLRQRIVEREPPEWSGLPGLLDAATEIASTSEALLDVDLVFSTERSTPQAIAEQITCRCRIA